MNSQVIFILPVKSCQRLAGLILGSMLDEHMTGWTESGRGERIRTSDHFTPSEVRYQAALRPEDADYSRGAATNDRPFSLRT